MTNEGQDQEDRFQCQGERDVEPDDSQRATAKPDRFGQGSGQMPDRKEQRRIDSAAGLVPFACKLPSELTQ